MSADVVPKCCKRSNVRHLAGRCSGSSYLKRVARLRTLYRSTGHTEASGSMERYKNNGLGNEVLESKLMCKNVICLRRLRRRRRSRRGRTVYVCIYIYIHIERERSIH